MSKVIRCTASPSLAAAPAAECAVLFGPQTCRTVVPAVRLVSSAPPEADNMHIRSFEPADVPALIDLTIAAFQPLFEADLPAVLDPRVFAHDHGRWEDGYRREVPRLQDPDNNFPATRPTTTPQVTGEDKASVSTPPLRSTPAFARAKIGTMT